MRKFGVFSANIFLSILLAGCYGIVHDQITYTISREYFTKYKYDQFGFEPHWFGGDRPTVAAIGFLATWWMGLFIGLVLGATAMIYKDHRQMRVALRKAISLTFYFAIATAIVGYLYGVLVLSKMQIDWVPNEVLNKGTFITVGSIHTFSYLGGVLGLIAGVFSLLKSKHKIMKTAFIFFTPAWNTSIAAQEPNNPFLHLQFDNVAMYDYVPSGEKGGTIINSSGKLEGKTLKKVQLDSITVKRLNQRLGSKKSYGNVTAFCFDPHLGIVYYHKGKVVAHISICFSCNRLRSSLDIPAQRQGKVGKGKATYYTGEGLSKTFRTYLNKLIKSYHFSNQIEPGSVFD